MFYKLINLFTRHSSLSFGINTTNTSSLLDSTGKYSKSTIFNYIRYIYKF